MDIAQDIPADYQPHLGAFFNTPQTTYGSDPSVAAGVIYLAATDNRPQQVRYYAGPESVIIPRVKQLLGPQWYWEEFRAANTTGASKLWTTLVTMPEDGATLEKNL
jgi:hypothetical protein